MASNCRAYLAKAWSIVCLLTVEPALFLVALGNGISDTATRVMMYDKVCIMLLNEVDRCVARNFTSAEEVLVQQEASLWEFYRTLTSHLPAVVLMILYANLVDRWSKKYTMFFTPIGFILSMIVYLVCSIFMESSPGYMLIGSLTLGFSGGQLAMMGACFSYLSATASPGMLIIHISLAEAALLASAAISSFASGVLLETVGYVLVYFIGIVINAVLIIYIFIRIKNIPLSAAVLNSVAAVADSSAAETRASPAALSVDIDELTIKMDDVPEVEIAGHLSLCAANGFTPHEKIAGGVEGNAETGESHLENGHLSQENHVVAKITEIETSVGNGKQVSVALSTLSDCLPIPSKESPSESQLKQTCSETGAYTTTKSTTCDVCSLCSQAAYTLWFYARMYVNTAIRRREHNKRRGILALLSIIIVEVICVYATGACTCYQLATYFISRFPKIYLITVTRIIL